MTAGRGRYGDGAVYKTSDGSWRGSVDLGRNPETGRRVRRYVRGRTKGEVNRKTQEIRDKFRGGEINAQSRRSLTVSEWLDQWLAGPAKLRLGEDMQRRYAQICRDHVKPTLGRIPLERLSPESVEALYADLAENGLSQRSVVFVHRVLGRAMKVAHQRGYVVRNVVRLVELETPQGRRGVALKPEEARAVLAGASSWRDHARWVVALGLGARQSEALGMRWDDLDLDAGQWHVRRQLRHRPWQHGCPESEPCGQAPHRCPERHSGGFYLKSTTKTEAGDRIVPLPPFVVAALREHREKQDAARELADDLWDESALPGLVFTTPLGKPVDHRNDHRRWKSLLVAAGVREVRLHDARHTTITLLAQAGVPRNIIALVVGHDDPAFTERVYTHIDADTARRASEAIQAAFIPEPIRRTSFRRPLDR
jgi:integrase